MSSPTEFASSPLDIPRLVMTPRIRVAVQVVLTTVALLAFYSAYRSVPTVLKKTKATGMKDAPDIPGWLMLTAPILAIIPGVYIFLFLKYNFNH